ncbi:hypothetical protein BGZ65_012385, partial [Modicella reniformis]
FYVDELSNEVTIGSFALLVQDLLRLFQAMNEGVINILQHYFEMSKEQARHGLKIYKIFAEQTTKSVEYFSVAKRMENVIHINIPQLKHAPLSLVRTLEEYLNSPDFQDGQKHASSAKDISPSKSTAKSSTVKSPPSNDDDAWALKKNVGESKAASGNNRELIDFFSSIENEETTIQQNPNTFQAQMLTGGDDFQAFQLQLQQQQFLQMQMQQMQQLQQNMMLQNQFTGMAGSQSFQPDMLAAQPTGVNTNPFAMGQQQQSNLYQNGNSMDMFGGNGSMNHIAPQSTGNPFRTGLVGMGASSLPMMTGAPAQMNTMPNLTSQATGSINPFGPSINPLNPFSSNFENNSPPASGFNVDNGAPATTTTTTTTTTTATLSAPADDTPAKRAGSPQASIENPFNDYDDDDLVVHPAPAAVMAPTSVSAAENNRNFKKCVEFVLESHRGNVEASINALLEISDPEFRPEPQQQPAAAAAPAFPPPSDAPPALPRRQNHPDTVTQGMGNMNLHGQNAPRTEIDPILLASTSTSEQQLRADEDFARTLAAMDEYRAREGQQTRRNQDGQQQQQHQEGPSFTQELKELIDEELPKIKERFNVAADTTKKKVNEWYTQFKTSRAESAARNQANQANQGQHIDNYRDLDDGWSNDAREPIEFRSRTEEDEPLARNKVTPPLGGDANPLPDRPYNVGTTVHPTTTATTAEPTSNSPPNRRTTMEDELDAAMNTGAQQPPNRR